MNGMPQSRRPRVLLADDHTVVAEGVHALLARDFELAGVARNGIELLKMAHELLPDVIIADIAMPVLTGLEATERLRKELPDCPVIILSGHETPAYVRAAFRVGAQGFVLKTKAEELPDAIRTVVRGKTFLPQGFDPRDLAKPGKETASPLSFREREILQLIAEGKAGKEIAAMEGISVRTVEFHKYNIMRKLSLSTTADLIRYAIQEGIAVDR